MNPKSRTPNPKNYAPETKIPKTNLNPNPESSTPQLNKLHPKVKPEHQQDIILGVWGFICCVWERFWGLGIIFCVWELKPNLQPKRHQDIEALRAAVGKVQVILDPTPSTFLMNEVPL